MNLFDVTQRITLSDDEYGLASKMFKNSIKALEPYFTADPMRRREARFSLRAMINSLVVVSSDGLEDKTLLDLGCGYLHSQGMSGQFEPWLCRALYELGYGAIGIDSCDAVELELFDSHCLDLMKDDALAFLEDNSIDIAHARNLFDAPGLKNKYGVQAGQALYDKLLPQLERVVKPNGVFVYDPTIGILGEF